MSGRSHAKAPGATQPDRSVTTAGARRAAAHRSAKNRYAKKRNEMQLNVSLAGRSYPPTEPYEVSREHIRIFAESLHDDNPIYRDPAAARAAGYRDVLASPTFLTVLSERAERAQVAADTELGLDYSQTVHGFQRFVHLRPVHPGDVLNLEAHIDDVRITGGIGLVTVSCRVFCNSTEHVATMYCTMVERPAGVPLS
ncbi:FAS1-like dehydratase domain-containing protein [Actinocatenispora comari]|uniref:FAS1-like dehydratase domain-containing protein n=1 Tax=Actinocatenispora comari TaxID=2807577 RepID=UPI001A913A1A|nr:MaoC family dehydratase N-terminal domain-containing protein [Actinocatenispora comari]